MDVVIKRIETQRFRQWDSWIRLFLKEVFERLLKKVECKCNILFIIMQVKY